MIPGLIVPRYVARETEVIGVITIVLLDLQLPDQYEEEFQCVFNVSSYKMTILIVRGSVPSYKLVAVIYTEHTVKIYARLAQNLTGFI
jgi:hypothetical protein